MNIDLSSYTNGQLAEIWSVLNSWEWHDLLGDKPEGFDEMLNYNHDKNNKEITKYDIIHPINGAILSKIGLKECLIAWNYKAKNF